MGPLWSAVGGLTPGLLNGRLRSLPRRYNQPPRGTEGRTEAFLTVDQSVGGRDDYIIFFTGFAIQLQRGRGSPRFEKTHITCGVLAIRMEIGAGQCKH